MHPPCAVLSSSTFALEHVLLIVLVQMSVIIAAARVFAVIFRWLKQPSVVGEIAAGLVLGPSLLGRWAPRVSEQVFDPTVAPLFQLLSQLGLILLLFLIGLEFDFSHLRLQGRAAAAISISGIVLPFALGAALGPILHPYLETPVDAAGFALFLGTALSITAIPVLGRMMMELNITRTRLGAITISAAAIDDAVGWILLAAVASIVQANFQPWLSVRTLALTAGFALFMLFAARPLLCRGIRLLVRNNDGELGLNGLALVLIVVFVCAVATNLIGIFSVFGAFILGAVLSNEYDFRIAIARQVRNFVSAFFLPIFFTYTGLRTDVGSLESPVLWLLCGLLSVVAVASKLGGCAVAARLSGFSWRESACIGAMMNTRALMALIVINLGMDLGVITRSVFCMLVLMALLTTIMTTPLLLAFMRGTELEPYIRKSGFVRPHLGADPSRARALGPEERA